VQVADANRAGRRRRSRLWRLDGATANTAEFLSVHGEALDAEVERCWTSDGRELAEDIGFIDLPGVDWRNPTAIRELSGHLVRLGSPHIHLVLNGAYDIHALLAQARAFSALPLEDLIVSHLDEEPHWGKLWNLTLGAALPIRHLSAGQNIPGDFWEPAPTTSLPASFPAHLSTKLGACFSSILQALQKKCKYFGLSNPPSGAFKSRHENCAGILGRAGYLRPALLDQGEIRRGNDRLLRRYRPGGGTQGLEKKARQTGAAKIYIDDLQEEFARDFIFPMMQAGGGL